MRHLVHPSLVLALCLAWAVPPAAAHHNFNAAYDSSRSIEFTGTVVRVEWGSPHIYVVVAVEQEDGSTVEYRAEGQPPNSLFRSGWLPDSVVPGEVVHFSGSPARSETSMNVNGTLRNEDGLAIYSGQAPSE